MPQDLFSSRIISLVTFGYMGAWLLYLMMTITRKKSIGRLASLLMDASLLAHVFAFFWRWRESCALGVGHVPLTNMFESLSLFSLSVALIYLVMELRLKERKFGVLVAPAAFLILAYSSLSNPDLRPLMPALKSNWLISHVLTCFLAYAAFTVAFILGLGQFLWPQDQKGASEAETLSGRLSYQALVFGFITLSAGILTGAVWAERAWGSYWSWDPKETFSLITWFIYALAIHFKAVRGFSERRMAILTTIGFLAMLLTYLGVNMLLPGLHSYANS